MRAILTTMCVVSVFLLSLFVGVLPASGGDTGSRLIQTPDGLTWSDPIKVTSNSATDDYPVLVVDSKGFSHIMFYQNNADHKYAKVQRPGIIATKEQFIVTGTLPTQHAFSGGPGQPTERIGIDSEENFHVIWTSGFSAIFYQKFANNGKPLSQQMSIGDAMSHIPYLDVGKNNRAYVCWQHEGQEYIRMIYIDKSFNLIDANKGQGGEYQACILASEPKEQDYIHLFVLGWSAGAINHQKFNSAGTELISPHATVSSGASAVMPVLDTSQDGNIHMLISSTTTFPTTLSYCKLDRSGNIITQCTPVTTNAMDWGDVVTNSDNDAYVIWGDADNQIHYKKIRKGFETKDASQPDNKVTNAKGQAKNPQFAVDSDDSLHVVWSDNTDGDAEIWYRYAFSFGVELGMSPEETQKVMFIHPEEKKVANITVKNLGGLPDSMYLNMTINFPIAGTETRGWDAGFDDTTFDKAYTLDLVASEIQKLEVWVKGPKEGNVNDFIEVLIYANSKENPIKNDTIKWRTFLVVDHNIDFFCADNIKVINAGDDADYLCTVKNTGDVTEAVSVSLIDGPGDWDNHLDIDFIPELGPKEETQVKFTITSPKDALADEVASFTLEAKTQGGSPVKVVETVHAIVKPNIVLMMSIDDPEKFVYPGETVDFELTVENKGNRAGNILIILEIVSGVREWTVSVLPATLSMAAGQQAKSTLTAIPPEDALAGDRLVLRVVASDEGRTLTAEVTATAIVQQVHSLEVHTTPTSQEALPGDTVKYDTSVKNAGNGVEQLTLSSLELPVGWQLHYEDASGAAIDQILLDPGSSTSFRTSVSVPTSALASSYTGSAYLIRGVLRDDRGNVYPINVETTVNQVFLFAVSSSLTKQIGAPGKTVAYPLVVQNLGNGIDNIKLQADGLPEDWHYEFQMNGEPVERIDLAPVPAAVEGALPDKVTVTLLITIPGTQSIGKTDFSVKGESIPGHQTAKVQLTLDGFTPNIVVQTVQFDTKTSFKVGKPVGITVTIVNEGTVDLDSVEVQFIDKASGQKTGTVLASQTLERLPGGGEGAVVVFTWVPSKAGPHTLTFKADPNDRIFEENEADNAQSQKVMVNSKKGLLPGFELPIAVLALLVVVGLVRRRRN